VPLQKTPLQINFARGLDQKTDPLQVQPGRFLGLKNRVFNKMGLLEKRNGYAAKGKSVISPVGSYTFSQIPGSVATGRTISAYADELLLNDGLNLYSYGDNADNWVYKGRVELCQTSEQSIYKNQYESLMPDSAINSTLGLRVYAWEAWTKSPYSIDGTYNPTLNGVQFSVVDDETNQVIYNTYVSSTGSRPKCVSISNKLYILYFDSNDNKIHATSVNESGIVSSSAIITNADTTTPNYDVIVNNSLVYVAYNGAASTVKVASFDSSMAAQASVSKSEVASNGIGIFADTSNNVWIAYNNATDTKAFIMNGALAVTVLAPTTVEASVTNVKNVTGVYDGTRGVIFYDQPAGTRPPTGQPMGDGVTNYMVTASFVQPAVGSTVVPTITGPSGASFTDFTANNSIVYIPSGGYYYISGAQAGSAAARLANLGLPGSAAPGATVASAYSIIYPTAGFQNSITRFNTLTAAGAAGTSADLMRSIYLAGKAFLVNSVPHVIAGYDSSLQSTYFACALYNVNSLSTAPRGVMVAKVGESVGGGPPYRSILPAVNTVSTNVIQFPFTERSVELLRTSNNVSNPTYFLGISSSQIDFTTDDILSLDLGRNLQIGSGLVQMYDGYSAVEQGFNYYPETVTATGYTSSTGGALTAGDYGYSVVYNWIDNEGQTHRSAPSPNVTYTIGVAPAAFTGNITNGSPIITTVSTIAGLQVGMSVSGSNVSGKIISIDSATQITISANATATSAGVTITPTAVTAVSLSIPTLRITEKQSVGIEIYRTAVNGTIYYRVDVQYLTYPVANSTSSDFITFVDFLADSDIVGNQQLYTEQEVDNIAPPAALFVSDYKNRAILIPSGNAFSWWYSKQVVTGSPVEFSDLFQQNMGTADGPLVGSARLDDKLILFKSNSIYYVTGTGPGPNGANNDFGDPQFITADCGLLDPRSVVVSPEGVMFKSAKGIYLLDRSLQTRYIGKDVENYNSYTVRGGQLIPKSNQIRFILSNGTCLLYDYYWKDESGVGQWAVFDPVSSVSDCIFQSLHTYLASDGTVYQETPGVYLDGVSGIATYFKTGWFNLAGLQGFERAYHFFLLAKYLSSHTLTINLYFDYDETTVVQTVTISPNASELEQWRIFLSKQKCEAFQIELTESGATGAGLSMSGLDILIGMKKGYPTIKAASSAG